MEGDRDISFANPRAGAGRVRPSTADTRTAGATRADAAKFITGWEGRAKTGNIFLRDYETL